MSSLVRTALVLSLATAGLAFGVSKLLINPVPANLDVLSTRYKQNQEQVRTLVAKTAPECMKEIATSTMPPELSRMAAGAVMTLVKSNVKGINPKNGDEFGEMLVANMNDPDNFTNNGDFNSDAMAIFNVMQSTPDGPDILFAGMREYSKIQGQVLVCAINRSADALTAEARAKERVRVEG